MTIESITVLLDYGQTTTRADARLANVTVLSVEREGLGHELTTGTPGNRDAKHNSGAGNIEFLEPGIQNVDAYEERVFVKYKY